MKLLAVAAVACGLAVTSLAGAAGSADPGITAKTILIGGTAPLSGSYSAFASVARGAEAYLKYVNARGGVHGRKITYKYVDDAFNPAQTVQAVRGLVQQDRVFAIYNSLGTEHNQAIRPFLNQMGVPHLFVASGARTWASDAKEYPWTIGYLPSYVAEGAIYGDYIRRTKPRARIAVLYQADDYTRDLITGLKRGLRGRGTIVEQEGYDPTAADVQAQVTKLARSGADTFMIFAAGKFAIQAFVYANRLNWRPQIFVNQVASAANVMILASESGTNRRTEGAITIGFLKDPTSAKFAKDPAMKLYRSIMKRYLRDANVNDVYHVYGMASAYSLVDALRKAGKNISRRAVMKAVTNLNERDNPFVLPGIAVRTTPKDRFPVEQAQLQRWRKGKWDYFGKLVSARG